MIKWYLPLTLKENSRLYFELSQKGAFCNGEYYTWKYDTLSEEDFFTLALLESRYDPRLFAILVDFFCNYELHLNPLLFKESLSKREALSISAVLGEYVNEAKHKNTELFRYLQSWAKAVPTQLFYKAFYKISGLKMRDCVEKPLWYFKKWGFLACDPPLLKERKQNRHFLYDLISREKILGEMGGNKKNFLLKDYLEALNYSISRQQALKDLNQNLKIVKHGKGRSLKYSLLKNSSTRKTELE